MNNKNDKISELQKVANDIRDAKLERTREIAKRIHQNVTENIVTYNIPEDVFKNYFAPYFKARLESETGKDVDPTKYEQWLCISGGPFKEVEIIDNRGDVVDVVPPVLLRPSPDKIVDDNVNLDGIRSNYMLKKNGLKDRAEMYLYRELGSINVNVNTKEDLQEHRKKWKILIDKYTEDLNDVDLTEEEQREAKSKLDKETLEKLDLDYD